MMRKKAVKVGNSTTTAKWYQRTQSRKVPEGKKYQGTQCSMAELEHKMRSWAVQLMTTMSLNPSLKDMKEIYQGWWKWLTL